MKVTKIYGLAQLEDIPEGYALAAFGGITIGNNEEMYYALLIPKDFKLGPEARMEGVRYAEGGVDSLAFVNAKVEGFKLEDGSYGFIATTTTKKIYCQLFPANIRKNTGHYHLIDPLM